MKFLVRGAAGLEDRNDMQSPVEGESCIGVVLSRAQVDVGILFPEGGFLGVEFDSTPNCTEINCSYIYPHNIYSLTSCDKLIY